MSSWTESFKYADYGERAKFLLSYLRMRPEPFDKKDPLAKGYKSVLAFIVASLCLRSDFRYVSDGAKAQWEKRDIDPTAFPQRRINIRQGGQRDRGIAGNGRPHTRAAFFIQFWYFQHFLQEKRHRNVIFMLYFKPMVG